MPTSLLRYSEALSLLESIAPGTTPISKSVNQSAGHTLAETICAQADSPEFDTSNVDGYAVRAEDLTEASSDSPVPLKVYRTIHAGDHPSVRIEANQAFKIMTGAQVPSGATAVVMREYTREKENRVLVDYSPQRHENIRRKGSEFKSNEELIPKGTRLGPIERGILLSQGIIETKVYPPAKVSVLVTGDELVSPEETPPAGKIRDVNTYTLTSLLQQRGNPAVRSIRIGDTLPEIQSAIEEAASDSDMILTTGGVSVGDKDFVPEAYRRAGFDILMHGVAVKPGKPLLLARHSPTGCMAFGLPGNVVSALMSYYLFVQPALRRMEGMFEWQTPSWYVRAGALLHNPGNRTFFIRARVSHTPSGMPIAFPTGQQSSGMLTSMLGADGAILVPADVDTVTEFSRTEFIPFEVF